MRIDGPQITGSFNLNGDTVADLDVFATTSSFNLMTASMATTGSNVFVGTQTSSGSIVPSVNNTYDLGSPTHQFRHVYISSGSLYVNGTKVLGSTAQELQITTDAGQSFKILESSSDTITLQSADGNITLATSGGGDVIMDPTNGVIGLKGTVTIYTGNKITSSDGNSIQFGNGIAVTGSIVSTTTSLVSGSSQITYSGLSGVPSNIISGSGQLTTLGIATTGSNTFNGNLTVTGFIDTQELRTTYISSSILYRSGSTKFGDELTDTHSFTGSILISGSISVPGSNLVSGSSQVLNGSGVFSGSAQLPSGIVSSSAQTIANLPSGVVSGSAQTIANLPSGTVSGSVQVDVMSTTNIARLATTGSNVFTGALTGTTATFSGALSATYGTFTSQVTVASPFTIKDTNPYIQWQNSSATRLGYIQHSTNLVMSADSGNVILTTTSGTFTLASTGGATFSSGVEAASFYTNDTRYIANQIQSGYNANSEDSDIWINYTGYQGGTTRFRDFRVGNGKQGQIALFDGSTREVTFSGNLTLSSSSSTTDLGGVLIVRGNGSAYSTHYLTTGAANVAKYIQYNASGVAINQINAGGDSYITGGNFGIGFTPSYKLQVAGEITTHAGTNTSYYAYMNYLGTTYNFGSGETSDNVDFKIAGGATWATGGSFRWFTQAGGTTPTERFRLTPTGPAYFTNKLTVGGTGNYSSATLSVEGPVRANRSIYSWYQAGTNSWDGYAYLHLKTNMWAGGGGTGNVHYTMSLFYARLYSYSSNYIREGSIGFHNWSGSIYNLSTTGNIFYNAYTSSDGYVVLSLTIGSGSYIGVTVDWHQAYGYPFQDKVVTAASASNSATGVY